VIIAAIIRQRADELRRAWAWFSELEPRASPANGEPGLFS
jgi:hypothetical protein